LVLSNHRMQNRRADTRRSPEHAFPVRLLRNTPVAFDPKEQRRIFGRFATGVTVLSTIADKETWGMTANAVTSLSLEPPLVLVAVVRNSATDGYLKTSRCFALNILSAEQKNLSTRFSGPGPRDFSDLETKTAVTGCPVLVEALGWVDCRVVDVFSGGDHEIFIGEIVAGDAHAGDKKPLLFYSGQYAQLAD
jgi:flavin reductase (DIM6/NTAB) family NADH-FMN oxidoreductase RutF